MDMHYLIPLRLFEASCCGTTEWKGKAMTYLEANISSSEMTGKYSNRSSVVGAQLLPIGSSVAGSVMPLYHRCISPCPLECYEWLARRNHHLLSAQSTSSCLL